MRMVRSIVGVLVCLVMVMACSSGPGNGFCSSVSSACHAKSSDQCADILAADAVDHPNCVVERDEFLGCMAQKNIVCKTSNTIYAGAGEDTGARSNCRALRPILMRRVRSSATRGRMRGSKIGVHSDRNVGTAKNIKLTPTSPTATTTLSMIAPGDGKHVWTTKVDLDVSAFLAGGTLEITGQLSSGGCDSSFDLFPACATLPLSGPNDAAIGSADNVKAGTAWSITNTFQRTPLFHFGAEGNWIAAAGSTNTSTVTFKITN